MALSARRYAQALFLIAEEKGDQEQWLADLELLADSSRNSDFIAFIDSPKIENVKKIEVIKEAFSKSVSEMALNFVSLLATRNSVASLPNIADAFQELVDSEKGVERAEIVSAVKLTDAQERDIVGKLARMVGKELSVTTYVDESILGGYLARVGDRLVDGSVKTQLENMRRELIRGA
ncbi:MAG: ATP synthase F1 subunit delta [SAR202 cluster bacterium]|mgnify:FL=1|jgi:F-type H+-transporting ATPase subunit delta|nr:ATP synthase F1 subunit delta [SAR202 cluster bacterium]HJO60763.1 ATP synthase F1 subunit delta [SAR202 cluster bacterium]|tara:strand:- start:1584 stop:2117 length:534 start_codon:yes stop_codon:yes gene_type:complete